MTLTGTWRITWLMGKACHGVGKLKQPLQTASRRISRRQMWAGSEFQMVGPVTENAPCPNLQRQTNISIYITIKKTFTQLIEMQQGYTFPPCAPRTAKQNRVDGTAFPGIENWEKAAACPSIGWLTLRSTEYSCMAPTTRFVWQQVINEKPMKTRQKEDVTDKQT